jgi:hypothetical protein
MHTPESRIKAAILHPVEEIREKALHYFSQTICADESIMPLVIQAVEKYGRETAFRILRDAERLPQTEATVDWLIIELRRDHDLIDVTQENYCIAVAWILRKAPPPILWKRFNEVFTAPAFPEQLREQFTERLNRFTWDWDRAWTALKYFGLDTMRRGELTRNDNDWAAGIVEALARNCTKAKKVLSLLNGQYSDEDPILMDWLRPCFVDLAGEMRLEDAVPLLMEYVGEPAVKIVFHKSFETAKSLQGPSCTEMSDSAAEALQRIGGDVVVRNIDARWQYCENIEFRRAAACILGHIRGDFSIERCLDYFKGEEDHETKLMLAYVLLWNFSEDAIAPLWKFLSDMGEDDLEPDERDLRYHLVAVCMIMGRTFPHFEEWHEAALRDNWGRFGVETGRVADNLKPDDIGPKWSEN